MSTKNPKEELPSCQEGKGKLLGVLMMTKECVRYGAQCL